jgi:hypothetical protein
MLRMCTVVCVCILMCARVYVCGCMHCACTWSLASVHVDSGALLAPGDEPAYSADCTSAARTGGEQQGVGRGAVEKETSRAAMEEEASRAVLALLGHVADKLWRPEEATEDARVLQGVVVAGHECMLYVVVGGHGRPRGGQAEESNVVANGGSVPGGGGMDWMAQLRPPQSCHVHNGRILSVQVIHVFLSQCSPWRFLPLSPSPSLSLDLSLLSLEVSFYYSPLRRRASICVRARARARRCWRI